MHQCTMGYMFFVRSCTVGSDVICFLYKKTKEATHLYVKLIHKVLHFVLQNLGLAGSLSVSTVSMTPCSDPHLTIVSDSLCSPTCTPPPRLVWPVGFARGCRGSPQPALVLWTMTILLHFKCSYICLHIEPVRWGGTGSMVQIIWLDGIFFFLSRTFFCPSRDMQDYRRRFSQDNLLYWLTGICCSLLVAGCDREGEF